jgi:hypothetical protein
MTRMLSHPVLAAVLAVIAFLWPWLAHAQVPRTVVTEVFSTTT